jgi:hypothetical protein
VQAAAAGLGVLVQCCALRSNSCCAAVLQVTCRAAAVLQHLLDNCPVAKQKLLDAPLDFSQQQQQPGSGRPAAPSAAASGGLLGRCARCLSDAARQGEAGKLAAAVLLRMLVVWLHEFPPAVAAFLRQPANLPLLADLANGKLAGGCPAVAGLSAVLLGVCLIHASSSSSSSGPERPSSSIPLPTAFSSSGSIAAADGGIFAPTAATVLDVITSRVGLSQYIMRLEDMKASELFQQALNAPKLPAAVTRAAVAAAGGLESLESSSSVAVAGPEGPGSAREDNPFDAGFVVFVEELQATVQKTALEMFSRCAGCCVGCAGCWLAGCWLAAWGVLAAVWADLCGYAVQGLHDAALPGVRCMQACSKLMCLQHSSCTHLPVLCCSSHNHDSSSGPAVPSSTDTP